LNKQQPSSGGLTGHLHVVELLIKRHANVKAADRKGNTALSLAQGDTVKEALQAALRAEEKKQEAETNAAEVPLGCEIKPFPAV
jgi:ankyrin repeat protein